ncbi:Zn-ribbon domain-containing OB-fold protein [Arthrobacter sp. NPDC089319]|uniref:Zn-ribbon domain-containing OB-fold protein n=1 Tax=Arthrobacter sp. NPDC089319 TaxID=3155915 RepID=UPI00341D6577
MTHYNRPLPAISPIDRPYWAAAREHTLLVQVCERCERYNLPASMACPACGGALRWTAASGRGIVHTFTIFHKAYHPGFADSLPYNVSIVELDEGPLVLTNVVDVDAHDLKIGDAVEVLFDSVTEEVTLPRFRRINS